MEITKELTDKILASDFTHCNNLDDTFVIMYGDKIFAPKQGRMFHATYQDAWKHFYNEYNWRVKSKYKTDKYGQNYYKNRSSIAETDTQIWNAFKNELFNNYDFRIIQWKDAKRDVCSESRT